MAFSRITRANFNAESNNSPCFPLFYRGSASQRADEVIELYGEGLGERQRRDPFEADEGAHRPSDGTD
jgi:hypothetical protein